MIGPGFQELFRRLFHSRAAAAEILVASFFVNVLFLASPIFTIQILSRYIGYGFDGTLYTLTLGMLMALALNVAFTVIRNRMCAVVSAGPDRRLHTAVLEGLARIKAQALGSLPQERIREVTAAPAVVQAAFDPHQLASVLDVPFFLLFFLAIFLLSPLLALVTLLALAATCVLGAVSQAGARRTDARLREERMRHGGGVQSAIQGIETVRAFRGGAFLQRLWAGQIERLGELRADLADRGSRNRAFQQGIGSLLRVSVYAVGAKLVVDGDLTVGTMIGISILASKALQIGSSFQQTVRAVKRAEDAMLLIREFGGLPREKAGGAGIRAYSGRLEFSDVTMAYPGGAVPLFESLSCVIEPGRVVGVTGPNGAGKTTLCKLVVGLVEPLRGSLLADNVDLRQLAPEWWRGQVMYLPQEPLFINGTFRDNITLSNPDIGGDALNAILKLADLRRFLDVTGKGIETEIADGGRSLPLGVRKRLALARALAVQGRLAVFDEPTEGLDAEGVQAVAEAMNRLARDGVTLIVVSRDPQIVKGMSMVIDLGVKPEPRVGLVKRQARPVAGPVMDHGADHERA